MRPSAYRSPAESRFRIHALTFDRGSWWAGGHDSNDELLGQLFFSKDGTSWKRVPGKHDNVKRLVRHAGKLYAVWFKSVDEVSPQGLVNVAKLEAHIDDVAFGSAGIVAVGRDFGVGALAPKAKRARYSAPLAPRANGRLVAIDGGFLLGDHEGLWTSPDGVDWEVLSSFAAKPKATKRGVAALTRSKDHALVLGTDGEVYAVRFG